MSDVRELGAGALWREDSEGIAGSGGRFSVSSPDARWDGSSARLARTIEAEIIPRLVLAHRAVPGAAPPGGAEVARARAPELSARVEEFARLVLARDVDVLLQYIEALADRGVPLETLYLDLLAPTARRLGEYWDADLCDFTEVTVGLCRLQQVVHDLTGAFVADLDCHMDRRVLLAPAPGESHAFGVLIVAEFFRRAGWDVWDIAPDSTLELAQIVRAEWFSVAGLSVSCSSRLDALAATIREMRKASCNKGLGIVVGGNIFVEHPQLVARVGADAMAADGREAVHEAQKLVRRIQRAG